MSEPDLNLLVALDALLAEANVAGAARRLGLSASAMSRTLTRLRESTGDALLVRAGGGMVLTPYAAQIRERTRATVDAARAVLRPSPSELDLSALERTFTVRANDAFVEAFAALLVDAVYRAAPHVRLHFASKAQKTAAPLREGWRIWNRRAERDGPRGTRAGAVSRPVRGRGQARASARVGPGGERATVCGLRPCGGVAPGPRARPGGRGITPSGPGACGGDDRAQLPRRLGRGARLGSGGAGSRVVRGGAARRPGPPRPCVRASGGDGRHHRVADVASALRPRPGPTAGCGSWC